MLELDLQVENVKYILMQQINQIKTIQDSILDLQHKVGELSNRGRSDG